MYDSKLFPILLLLSSALVQAQDVAQPFPCLRWAHQSTVAQNQGNNGQSIWIFGGRARTHIGQALDTWTNALIKLDLNNPFPIGNPPLEVVQSDHNSTSALPSPPRVALGALASNKDGSYIYQYFGQFSDTPPVDPTPNALWRYDVAGNRWSTVETDGDTVQRAAEGAAVFVPNVGTDGESVAYYFGGHQDVFTTENWSGERIFLSSMTSLDLGSHTWKNMTTFGTNGDSGSRNTTTNSSIPPILRADSTLTYVPNLGTDNKGVLVAIGGGNENQMVDNTVLDVYDIGAGAFVKQATQGHIMTPRVNHCAVRGSAIVNGQEQHQIFVYGGHASNRTTQISEGQDTDVYILSVPSYTWTYAGNNLTSQPTARAGHTCELLGDQMVVVGGYIREDLLCEQPGIYILNTTSLEWATDFVPGSRYQTPELVKNITGGIGVSDSTGGNGWSGPNNDYTATVTQGGNVPSQTQPSTPDPTDGDLQEGKPGHKLGAILGGVIGGLCLLFLIIFLVNFFAKRQRRREREKWSGRLLRQDGYSWSADDDQEGAAMVAMPYSDMRGGSLSHEGPRRPMMSLPLTSQTTQSSGQQSSSHMTASDNVESDTEGMHVSGMSHLAPRETLRVTNPSMNRSVSSLAVPKFSGVRES